ncbi:hypothetical protein [Galactobacter valiniphilus]|uniref:hypothetical protein n=1 Tax=Galactobacter valiniphilus TaxID=2676122 RepID=UPI0011C4A057|nr:hypothetical protein [Galactobacter valiniphilus]
MIRGNQLRSTPSARRPAALLAYALTAARGLAACSGTGIPGVPTDGTSTAHPEPHPSTHGGRSYSLEVFVNGDNARLADVASVTVCLPPTDGAGCPDGPSLATDRLSTFESGANRSTLRAGTALPKRWDYIQVEVNDASGVRLAKDILEAQWQLTDSEDHGIGQADLTIRLE